MFCSSIRGIFTHDKTNTCRSNDVVAISAAYFPNGTTAR